ncbi:MAG: transposase [Actinobacteria bacterium]|nr:transposase [Actinomycetota bacterium]
MKRFLPQQIVEKLRQADVELGKGANVPEVYRKIEVSQQTYYRWRQRYGGMSPQMIKELKDLQKENQRLWMPAVRMVSFIPLSMPVRSLIMGRLCFKRARRSSAKGGFTFAT